MRAPGRMWFVVATAKRERTRGRAAIDAAQSRYGRRARHGERASAGRRGASQRGGGNTAPRERLRRSSYRYAALPSSDRRRRRRLEPLMRPFRPLCGPTKFGDTPKSGRTGGWRGWDRGEISLRTTSLRRDSSFSCSRKPPPLLLLLCTGSTYKVHMKEGARAVISAWRVAGAR